MSDKLPVQDLTVSCGFYDGFDIELNVRIDPNIGEVEHSFEVKQELNDYNPTYDSLKDAKQAIRDHWSNPRRNWNERERIYL